MAISTETKVPVYTGQDIMVSKGQDMLEVKDNIYL